MEKNIEQEDFLEYEDFAGLFEDVDFKEISPLDTNSDMIKVSRFMAQADFEIETKDTIDKNGKRKTKKTATPNDEKIADTCIEIFQQSDWDKKLNYEDLREKALEILKDRFIEAELILTDKTTSDEALEISKRKEIAISQTIREIIKRSVNTEIEYPFNEFIERTGIKSAAAKLNYALKLLDDLQGKSFYQWKQPVLSKNLIELTYELVKVSQIPTIKIVLTEEGGNIFDSFTEFKNSKMTNKRKYIKAIKFDINNSFVPYLIGLGKDYTKLFRKERNKFSSSYAFKLDMYLKSIFKVQHIDALNKFTFEDLQKKFGTEYPLYKNFKEFVLKPALKDLNEHTNYNVELIEKRENNNPRGALKYVRFRIKPKVIKIDDKKFGVNPVAYYVSSRLFYFSNQKIKNIQAFARGIERDLKRNEEEGLLDLVIYGDKYISQWEKEAIKAIKIERELLKLLNKHTRFLSQHGIYYDESRMCIMEEYIKYNNEKNLDEKQKRLFIYLGKKITNPMESIEYINQLVENEITHKANIFDYIPFEFYASNGKILVEDIKTYQKYEDQIKRLIVEKKISFFNIPEITREIFNRNVMRENFLQIDNDFKDLVRKLSE